MSASAHMRERVTGSARKDSGRKGGLLLGERARKAGECLSHVLDI